MSFRGNLLFGRYVVDEGWNGLELERAGDRLALAGIRIAVAVGELLQRVPLASAVDAGDQQAAHAAHRRAVDEFMEGLIAGNDAFQRAVRLEGQAQASAIQCPVAANTAQIPGAALTPNLAELDQC